MNSMITDRPELKVWIDNADVTTHLGDLGSVRTQKHLEAPMGQVHINFPDMPTAQRDSLYGTIPVMAPLRIEARRGGGKWTPLLRGFVRAVGRDEQVGGDGRVQRMVTVIGHDCGAAFVMESMHRYISAQNEGKALPQQVMWFRDWVKNGHSELYSVALGVGDFIKAVAVGSTTDILQAAGYEWSTAITVTHGWVLPANAKSNEGPVWELIKRYSDSPWNEVFVREGAEHPELVFRPTPWVDETGTPLAEVIGESIKLDDPAMIKMRDVLSLSAHRDDSEVTNHIWVESPAMQTMSLVQATRLRAGLVQPDTRKQFGDRRPSDTVTWLLPSTNSTDPARPQKQQAEEFSGWILPRRNWALKALALNHQMERGSIVMRGNPKMRVGDHFFLQRGTGALTWMGYITSVSHDYQPFRRYLTTIEYIRGTQWIERRKMVFGAWDKERAQS